MRRLVVLPFFYEKSGVAAAGSEARVGSLVNSLPG